MKPLLLLLYRIVKDSSLRERVFTVAKYHDSVKEKSQEEITKEIQALTK